jgi:xanthine dehydrogenase small subunit
LPAIDFQLNGRPVTVCGPETHTTLLDYLRGVGLTGAKEGCAEGECGACTVLTVAPDGERSQYRAVNSCLMLLPLAAGHEIYTVESLAEGGKLCEAQAAMAEAGGSQCGYCTPGFVMSLFAEQYRPDREGACDPHRLAGNLCRCTGYRPIRDAALSLGSPPPGRFRDRLAEPAPRLNAVRSECFSRPGSIAECLDILAADPEAKLIAGGTDLGVESNLRATRWRHLVSLEVIQELKRFEETSEQVTIGAGLPLTDLLLHWKTAPPAVAQCLLTFASPTIRNRATLGGNLANASPIGDTAPLLMALDASVVTTARTVTLASLFSGYRRTVLKAGEFITAVVIPKPFPELLRFFKVSKRRMDDISTVAAAMAVSLRQGCVVQARIAYGGVASTTIRAVDAEAAIAGQPWSPETMQQAQEVIARTLQPMSDHRGSAAYRLAIAQSLLERFWHEVSHA